MKTMKLDSGLPTDLAQVGARARKLEAAGYDGALTAEIGNDPFLPLVLAAEHTERIELIPRSRSRSRATRCCSPTSATT